MLFEPPRLDAREVEVVGEIDDLRYRLRSRLHEPRRWTGSLRRVQFARAVQGSNSIEGYDAKLDDAVAIEMGEPALDASEETSLAIKGYRDAMTYVLQLAEEPRFHFGEQLVKSLHFMMTNYDLKNRPGRWRSGPIYVQKEETGEIVYEGVDVDLVDKLMHELVCRLEADEDIPIVVKAAMAHLNLVLIHPFRDGNGRMARCLQTLVLAREGIVSPVFSSIEEYLGRNTRPYYDVLGEVGAGSWQPKNDTRPWVRYVLTAHLRQARTVLRRTKEIEAIYIELDRLITRYALPERTMEALFDAATGMRVRRSVYRAILEGQSDDPVSEQTATRDLQSLAAHELLVPHGERRGRFYTAGAEIMAIRERVIARRDPRDNRDPFAIQATDRDQQKLF
ncbi:filamentation induced by cAMP protein fic [Mycobacteroides abscessus subsp. abscessus]|uniref:Fic family protein n=1 Tax=Mycobacteroides abscessus TaxID=36809 RepID=UPI0009A70127|nr:Fic family protein [Mycobacteroides abscessus]QSM05012.1 Fic family protein [Mycobacterium phage prophiGD12-2]MBN7355482.1 Fic family protein [Mycobacteroides abscessus subsp. abscessus]MBN7360261.1 Fic family protein [Mycobacteroides abscessus subsp. abscessus]MBN7474739.1 Fic family protein [Mycobacteroides abscessus subsp. abscessus]SLI65747.1 filamentation induced by cAMP protein fic [Mycobacteroides abscessus subsp. abscessus]